MSKPFSSQQQQEGHFRNSVSDGGSPRGAVPIPSDPPVIPMSISQNTHGVVVYSPSLQDGHFTRDHNTCQPTKARTSQITPVVVSPDGYNRNKCFISGADGSGPLDHQATMKMNGEDVPKKQCPCGGGTCIVKTSHTEKNPNRLFYKCPAKICNFFQWCDGLGPSSQSPLKPGQGCSRSPGKIIKPQNTSLEPKNPTCSCKAGPCIVQTMHEGENKGRKYYACPIKKGHGACKHFEWVDSPVKPPETESNSKINQNNILIIDVATPEPKQTLSPYESVNDLFGENDKRTIEFWCKEKDPNSAAATGSEINKQLSPGTIRVDSPVKPPETESNSKRNQNNISIVDVTTLEAKQTLSPYESVKDLFGENDMRTIEFWCKEKDPNSTAATGSEINKQLSPGKRPHQPNTMGDISPMKRLNLSDAFQVAENCPNCGKRGQCIECPILTCFKDDDFSENKHGNAMDGGNISTLAPISPIGESSVQNLQFGHWYRQYLYVEAILQI
ncbi:uncharacterized protein LOC144553757 [Carex rostrata]